MKLFAALLLLTPVRGADLLVAAASDLAPVTGALQRAYTGASLRFSLGSSGSLARQIENGAPFDVFLSANQSYVEELAKEGRVDASSVVVYAIGRIALWSRDGAIKSLDDLARPGVQHIAIPNPEHAPYGIAAREALKHRGLWTRIEPKIVYGENVRQALQFAETGNADAVITSWTLLEGRGILIPAEWHNPIRQAGAVVTGSAQAAAAREFLKFLSAPEGKKILEAAGLAPAGSN